MTESKVTEMNVKQRGKLISGTISVLFLILLMALLQNLLATGQQENETKRSSRATERHVTDRDTTISESQKFQRYYAQGVWHLEHGKPDSAAYALELALSLKTNHQQSLLHLGRAYLQMEELDKAGDVLTHAAGIDSNNSRVHHLLGRLRHMDGNHEKAEHYFKRALEMEKNPYIRNNLAYTYILQEEYEKAIPLLERAAAQKDVVYFYNNLGVAYQHTGKTAKALKAYQQALNVDPEYTKARENLSLLKAQSGQPSDTSDVASKNENNLAGN